jgi:hypothetical protein
MTGRHRGAGEVLPDAQAALMLRAMSRLSKSALIVLVLACASTAAAGRSASTGLAPTCGTISIGGRQFLVEITSGRPSCATARSVLSRARFRRDRSGVPGWECWQGTPKYGFTSVVDGCDGWPAQIEAVPTRALPRIGKACRLFLGPGDTGIHAYAFRVHAISCQTGKEVVEICDTDGQLCNAGTSGWYCKQPKQHVALGFGERCVSGTRFTSLVWLD